jgi:Cu/Ag efflux protein CusF
LSKSFHFSAGAAILPPVLLTLTVILLGACSQQEQAGKPVPTPQASPPATSPAPENPATAATQGVVQPPVPLQTGDVRTYSGSGVVTIVNSKEGWVEINHGEIKGLMPAMQMSWFVKNISLLGSIKVGDTVNFEIEYSSGNEALTKLEKVQSR